MGRFGQSGGEFWCDAPRIAGKATRATFRRHTNNAAASDGHHPPRSFSTSRSRSRIAVAGGFAASWLRQSPILGYLLAGVIIGPFTPGFVGDREQIAVLADVGVIFLMFGLGVAFSLKDLARVRAIATIGTIVQVALTIVGGLARRPGAWAGTRCRACSSAPRSRPAARW